MHHDLLMKSSCGDLAEIEFEFTHCINTVSVFAFIFVLYELLN